MAREQALKFLMEDCRFSTPLTLRAAEEIWESRKAIVENLPSEEILPARKLPLSAADLKAARKFRSKHPDAHYVVDFVRLNPMDLIVHQLWVSTAIADGYRDRVAPDKWLQTALLDPPSNSGLKSRREGNTIIFDLPHSEFFLAGPLQPNEQMRVSEADGFVTVAFHANRALLLRGYHRTFACAQFALGALNAPHGVLFGVSNQLASMGSEADNVRSTMEGPRPPRMSDWFDDRFSLPVTLRRRQYRMQIHYEVTEIDEGETQTAVGQGPLTAGPEFAETSRGGIEAEPDVLSENRQEHRTAKTPLRSPNALRNARSIYDDALRHYQAGRIDEAVALYERVLFLKPDHADTYNNLGVALVAQGRMVEAITHYERALVLNPDDANARSNLGMALAQLGRIDEAVVHYERALALNPDHPGAHNNLSVALLARGRIDEAVAHSNRALALQPNDVNAHTNLGFALAEQGRIDDAMAHYKRALAIDPDHATAHNNLGNIFKEQGKFDDAVAHYGRAITIRPDYAAAHFNRAEIKTFQHGDDDLAALEGLAGRNDLPVSKAPYIHFALSKALEDTGDYVRAFEHMRKGNASKRGQIEYDEPRVLDMFRRISTVFDRRLFEREVAGELSSVPIFVVGMPRSGSTLVEQILASHPQIHGAGELGNLEKAASTVLNACNPPVPFPECIPTPDALTLRRIGQSYLASLPSLAEGKVRIVDKLPDNFLRIGLIRLILPNARIIHTMRHPIDTCVSCYSKLFTVGQQFSYDLVELGHYYGCYNALMTHWRTVLPPDAMLDVSYEDVVDNLEGQARRLIDYCGLPWDDRCVSFHKTSRSVRTASNVQVRKPLFRSSLERWRNYEAGLAPLLHELGDIIPAHVPARVRGAT